MSLIYPRLWTALKKRNDYRYTVAGATDRIHPSSAILGTQALHSLKVVMLLVLVTEDSLIRTADVLCSCDPPRVGPRAFSNIIYDWFWPSTRCLDCPLSAFCASRTNFPRRWSLLENNFVVLNLVTGNCVLVNTRCLNFIVFRRPGIMCVSAKFANVMFTDHVEHRPRVGPAPQHSHHVLHWATSRLSMRAGGLMQNGPKV